MSDMKIKGVLIAILLLLLLGCRAATTARYEPLDPNDPRMSPYGAGLKKAARR